MRLDPFQKPLGDVDINDLARLSDFCEQLFVEYKGPSKWGQNRDIAKSIASFANAWGGWLFIGLDADEANCPRVGPGEITGIPLDGTTPEETLYQIASDHISPRPHFLVHLIRIAGTHFVAAVAVPESPDPPHVHIQSGTVPVRDGNRTEPLRLDDRSELDRLYQKAEANRASVAALLDEHERGMRLTNYIRQMSHRLWGRREASAFWQCLFYPNVAIEGLFPYAVERGFPNCEWPGRDHLDLSPPHLWSDGPPRRFGAHEVYVLSDEDRGYYLNTDGHFCYGEAIVGKGHARFGFEERLKPYLEIAELLYKTAGYHGTVGLEYSFGDYGESPTLVRRFTEVDGLSGLAGEGMGDEVARLLGMWNREGESRQ